MTLNIKNKIIFHIIPFFIGVIISFSLPPYKYLFVNFIFFPILFIFFVSNITSNKWVSFKIGWLFGFGYFLTNYGMVNPLGAEGMWISMVLGLIIFSIFIFNRLRTVSSKYI